MLWIDPDGVINHKPCVITTGPTTRLQGRFETRTWVRSGWDLIRPGSVFFVFFFDFQSRHIIIIRSWIGGGGGGGGGGTFVTRNIINADGVS